MTTGPLFLPALQGGFGNWTYYTALMRLGEIVSRVGYATQLQENPRLAQQIQRRLDNRNRAEDIAQYLLRSEDRFFNALVVGVLGGQPEWHPFSLSSRIPSHELGAVTERDQDLVGYLQLSGEEKLFALDGQHRLAGIRRALESKEALAGEKLTVIFVPHIASASGLIRTRSLFISLNKKAVPVKRKDIIILDEVDIAAVITRQLVDLNPHFNTGIVDVDRFGNAMPATAANWTTIGNFYDINKIIIGSIVEGRDAKELEDATKVRLSDQRIEFYKAGVIDFYKKLAQVEPLIRTVLSGDLVASSKAVLSAKTRANPRLLARPVGLKIIVRILAEMRTSRSLDETFSELRRVPLLMNKLPFAGVIWDVDRGKMNVSGESLAFRLLAYMLGLSSFDERLRTSVADWFGEELAEVKPPKRLPAAK